MAFSNLKQLDEHLSTRSYVEGYTPSQADVGVFKSVGSAPDKATYPNAARWYAHIKSYEAEHASLPGDAAAGAKLFGGASTSAPAAAAAEEEEEIDLFGEDDEEDAEAERVKAERVAAYNAKKANKPKTIAKSVVTLEVKPWDDETDMAALEKSVRSVEQEGLVWGSSKLVAIGYGIKKLQITLVIEDELVSLDELQEKIAEFEDYVQSSDVAAMQRPLSDQKRDKTPRGVRPSSRPKKPSSPNKTPKRRGKLDFSTRRSIAGFSSSPAKPDLTESSEAGTDVSSDVNEVRFEEPGKPSTQRRRVSDLDSDSDGDGRGMIDVESSEEEVPVVRRKRARVVAVSDSEEEGVEVKGEEDAAVNEEAVVNEEADHDQDRAKRQNGVKKEGSAKEGETVKKEEDVMDMGDESEGEEYVRMSMKKAGKRKAVVLSLTPSSEDESDNQEKNRGGRIIRHKPVEPEEPEESEEDIMDGLDEDGRKLGQDTAVSSSESSESESDDGRAQEIVRPRGRRVFKPIPGAQPTLEDWFSNAGSSDHDTRVAGTRQGNTPDSDREDDSDDQDSWIEDDGGEINVPILPEEYSMLGHQSLAHHFKVVMQMFVHLACTKARKRWAFRKDEKNDQYFGLALRALRRKMDGMRDSLVVSSVWTSSFKKALNSHPELSVSVLEYAVPGCSACRISSRLSTFRATLDVWRLQPVVKNEDDTDDDDQEAQSTPGDLGHLGRYCQARVRCYHNFVHWEWQLFETINAEIEVLRTARLRNDRAQPERPAADDPDGVMAWLDRRGVVEQEWHRLEQLMEAARGLEFRKGNEDD
ncbi:Translation elongation factor 1 beta [Ceratobasidium sp. 414]|nr:Translation elongation factor 1 beta [Ceratobasidium sp. 414]